MYEFILILEGFEESLLELRKLTMSMQWWKGLLDNSWNAMGNLTRAQPE